ncbi:MAG: hypothetical protein SFT94_02185 [Pseudanabaenaceae cyanobacterium bins.68]|nr:hypothetical protein [Pseudanabaenaceae cyanobacterium bins.68]
MAVTEQILRVAPEGLPPIEVIYAPTRESQRWHQNWITGTEPTARGVSVFKGASARLPIYRWTINTKIPYWKALRLDRLNRLSQTRLGANLLDGLITLTDQCWLVDSASATQAGRTIVQTLELRDDLNVLIETGSYCSFKVELILPNGFLDLAQGSASTAEDLNRIVTVNFELKEV